MKTLTLLQTQVLQAAASGDDAGLADVPAAKLQATRKALAKAGLIVVPETDDGFLTLTETGRAALSARPQPGADDAESASTATDAEPPAPKTPKGKLGALIALLRRPEGATLEEMMEATGWQAHSVRGAIAGAIKKKQKLTVTSEKSGNTRIYRIVDGEAA
jgi:hypothetical protein